MSFQLNSLSMNDTCNDCYNDERQSHVSHLTPHSSQNSSLQRFNSSYDFDLDLDFDGLEESLVDDTCVHHNTSHAQSNQCLNRFTKTRLTQLLFDFVTNGTCVQTTTQEFDQTIDSTFIDDFLLTFRFWQTIQTPLDDTCSHTTQTTTEPTIILMTKIIDLMTNSCEQNERTGCVRLVLQWIESHFQDFTQSSQMTSLLRKFEEQLKQISLKSEFKLHLKLYYLALSAKSRDRRVTLNRNNSDDLSPFQVIGGYECHSALFVDHVNDDDVTYGVTRGDRLIQINGIDVTNHVTITRANQLLTSSSVVSLVVRFDPSAYYSLKQLLNENKEKKRNNRQHVSSSNEHINNTCQQLLFNSTHVSPIRTNDSISLQPNGGSVPSQPQPQQQQSSRVHNKWSKQSLNSLMNRFLPKALSSMSGAHASSVVSLVSSTQSSQLLLFDCVDGVRHTSQHTGSSGSNSSRFPVTCFNSESKVEVLKVYYEKEYRFLVIRRETTAREVVQLAFREFSLNSNTNQSSRDYALYEIQATPRTHDTTTTTTTTQSVSHVSAVRRLADSASDLVTNLSLNSRIYLKQIVMNVNVGSHVSSSQSHVSTHSDSIAKEISNENPFPLSLLSLDGSSVAMEITKRDFQLFSSIESQQFIYDLMSSDTCGQQYIERKEELNRFEMISNSEMFWTINECLKHSNSLTKRVKTIKQFIKICDTCHKLSNFNTLFAIISGLQHISIQRLRQTWERVPHKHQKQFKLLSKLLDPSKNMWNYRKQLSETRAPAIPFFPLIKKDIAFVHLANESIINVLDDNDNTRVTTHSFINWDKMRLLSQKIRQNISYSENSHLLEQRFIENAFAPHVSSQSTTTTTATHVPSVISVTQKKLWDHSVMTKRVQKYLSDIFENISMDEQALMLRSMDCEAPPTQTNNSNAIERRSQTSSTCSAQSSPTPSMASSCSTQTSSSLDGTSATFRTRFGAHSPQQLRKLLALSSSSHMITSSVDHHLPHTCHSSSHHSCQSQQTSQSLQTFNSNSFHSSLNQSLITCHACHQTSQHNNASSNNSTRVVTSLPVESSSVTSLRRLEQLQQLSRFRDQWRRPLPDYQQTMERRLRQTSDSRIHVQMSPRADTASTSVTSEHVV